MRRNDFLALPQKKKKWRGFSVKGKIKQQRGPVTERKKHNKRNGILGCRLIPISWYIDSDLRGELILAHALSPLHFDPAAVGSGLGWEEPGTRSWPDG